MALPRLVPPSGTMAPFRRHIARPMVYELLVGLRYTRSRKRAQGRNRFISFISAVSMLGIALGVAALITVLSVMNGFQEELRSRILGVAAHIQVSGLDGELGNWQQVADQAAKQPDVLATAPFVQAQGMLSFDQVVRGTLVRGILPAAEETVADFARYMRAGTLTDLRPGEFGIILGADLAYSLRVRLGDKVTLIAPQGLVTPAAVLPRLKQFRVVGVFEAGMIEYDAGLALIHMADAQTLYQLGEGVSGVRLKVADIFDAPRVARQLASHMEANVLVSDWTHSHANFFRAVALEKTMMTIILFLIVAVAAFNIVSTLVMAVQEKYADIAILRTLGASPGSIMAIFVLQGSIIGVVGLLAGVIGGFLLATNLGVVIPVLEKVLGVTLWNKEIYYISEMPSQVLGSDVTAITSVSFVLTLLAALYPSWRASRVNPAEALRYE
jgi:lipoprotein-releasing system permease protein